MIKASKAAPRAATYVRMSDVGQEQSIPAQLAEIKKYARQNGYQIVRDYEDRGISGDDASRAGFNRLIQDAKTTNDFDVVLCWDQDRFSRFDTLTANHYWYQLREAGVRIVTVNQGEIDFNSISSVLLATVNQYSSNEFLKKLSKNVCRGMKNAAELGNWINGRPPFGYHVTDGAKLTIFQPEADIIRAMFADMIRGDIPMAQVCRSLNDQQIPTPTGRSTWRVNTLKTILSNRAYIGTKIYGLKPKGKHCRILAGEITPVDGRGRRKSSTQSESDCIVVEGAYPAIISESIFADVQQIISKRSCPKRTRTTSYLLSGLMCCGHCGSRCHGQRCLWSDRTYLYYGCGKRKDTGAKGLPKECGYLFSAKKIEEAVIDKIANGPLAPKRIEHCADEIRRQIAERVGGQRQRGKRLEKIIDEAAAAVESLENRLADAPADMVDALYRQIRSARERRDNAQIELAADRQLSEISDATVAGQARNIIKRLHSIRHDLLKDGLDAERRRALQRVVERIEIFSREPDAGARKNTKRSLARLRIVYRKDFLADEQSGVSSLG